MKKNIELSLNEFSLDVASNKSMPGGGSVCGYSLSLANSLASMVANFTLGKKNYIEYDIEIKEILEKIEILSPKILELVDKDCEAFLELKDVYGMPNKSNEEKINKEKMMDKCLKKCADVPFESLMLGREVCKLHERLLTIGNKMLISDVGVGVCMLKSAVQGAKINILINIKGIKDVDYVDKIWSDTIEISEEIIKKCDYIYNEVLFELS